MANYYAKVKAKDLESHWDPMGDSGLHLMSVAYRGAGDMTLWAQGRLDPGLTPRLEWEWAEFFEIPESVKVKGAWLEEVFDGELQIRKREFGGSD